MIDTSLPKYNLQRSQYIKKKKELQEVWFSKDIIFLKIEVYLTYNITLLSGCTT